MATINGTTGDDTLIGTSGDDVLSGSDGNDVLVGGAGNDTLTGGPGSDIASFRNSTSGVRVFIAQSSPQDTGEGIDTLNSIEGIEGSDHNDVIIGDDGANFIDGRDGDDAITGSGGVDDLRGGPGNDVYIFQNAADHQAAEISDTSGYDIVRFASSSPGTLTLYAGDVGIDRVEIAFGIDLRGSPGATNGLNIDATLVANGLEIVGDDSSNILLGTSFDDIISGGRGADRLSGGAGHDVLSGGLGYDIFSDTAAAFNGDTITDFVIGEKIIFTDAILSGFTFSLNGTTLNYTGGSLTLDAPISGSLVASEAAGGGVQLTVASSLITGVPPVPGTPNTQPIYGRNYFSDPAPDYSVDANSYLYLLSQYGNGQLFPWGLKSLTNNGTIFIEDQSNDYGDLRVGPQWSPISHVRNNGKLVIHSHSEISSGIIAFADGGSGSEPLTVDNSGQVYLINDHFSATFLLSYQLSATVTNSGSINLYTPEGNSTVLQFVNGGVVTNSATGRILAEGVAVGGIFMGLGNVMRVDNAGLIELRSMSSQPSVGVYFEVGGELNNSGTITADIAAASGSGTITNSGTLNGVILVDEFGSFTNLAGGTLNGSYIGGLASQPGFKDTIDNAGTINGDVATYDGDDVVINRGAGVVTGIISLGFGADHFTGSGGVDRVAGEEGADVIATGGGNDLVLAGSGDDWIAGEDGNDGLYGELGRDTILTLGGDVVDAGAGNDRVELGDYTFRKVAGGSGDDTLVLAPGATMLDLTAAIASGRLSSFEIIEMRAGQGLSVRAGDVLSLSGSGTLRIDGDSSDIVTLVGSWTRGSSLNVANSAYWQWTSNGRTALVEAGVVVNISNLAPPGAVGLSTIAPGSVPLTPGVKSGLNYSPTDIEVSSFATGATFGIDEGQLWYSLGTGSALRLTAGATLTVDGTILGLNESGPIAVAIDATSNYFSTTINNHGVISAESDGIAQGTAGSWFQGVAAIPALGALNNDGIIDAYAADGTAIAAGDFQYFGRYQFRSSVGSVSNTGVIRAQSGSSFAVGVYTGAVNNSGTIHAAGPSGAVAVYTFGNVSNFASGEISAVGIIGATAIRMNDVGGGPKSIVNAGIISGETAILVETAPLGFSLTNSGAIYGSIVLPNLVQRDVVQNIGQIAGDVHLGGGNDLFDGRMGVQSGVIFGEVGDDVILGGAGNDQISGGQGIDVLTGGSGADRFIDTAADLNGDTITDLGPGDTIVLIDAAIDSFAFSVSGNKLIYTGGSLTLTTVPWQGLVANVSAAGGVQLTVGNNLQAAHAGDFNGDGRDDLLLRSDTGAMSTWLTEVNGTLTPTWGTTVSLDWKIAGTGDFNGDGKSDVLWRSDTGGLANWQGAANGGFTPAWGTTLATDWKVVGTGDFNGDGKDDILWRSTSGALSDWLGSSTGGFGPGWGTSVDTSWKVAGAGDFNGDGKDDILWRSSGGQLATWLGAANGGFTPTWGTTLTTDWNVVGTGDFNGDGRSDVLWRSDAGAFAQWLGAANGGFTPTWGTNVPANLHAVSIGDFNNDGRDDILWQSDSNHLSQWLGAVSGGFSSSTTLSSAVPTGWVVQPEVTF